MTARVYDIYDLNAPFVAPTAPATTPTATAYTATATAPTATTRRDSDRLLRAGAYLLTFAGVVLLLAALATFTPLGRIDADITVPFVVVVAATLTAIAWDAVRA